MANSTEFQKKNSIVTGGAGFIGSHLCEALLAEGRVICIDNLSNASTDNIEPMLSNPDFVFIKHDVCQPLDLESLPELERFRISVQGIQEVFHLACPMSVQNFNLNRIAILDANSAAVKTTLDWAVKYKARYVFASSACVYGPRVSDLPVKENTLGILDHMTMRAAYDEGKRFAETMISTYADIMGVDARVARIFRTYGPRLKMHDAQMITDFVVSALDNAPMVVYGAESMKTTLLYVTDAVSALMKLAKVQSGVGPMNIGSEQEYTFAEIAGKVKEIIKSESTVAHEEPLEFLSEHVIPDITYAKQVLGWMPMVRLENGLDHLADYVSANRNKLTYSV
jgi:UDP-glucuronate decarboxylase